MSTTKYQKTYSELILLPTFEERFNYLKLDGHIGEDTFGYNRYINQSFYQSLEWKKIRDAVIIRDSACDLAILGREIHKYLMVHHINPITVDDLVTMSSKVFDLENLICVSRRTHNAIHFSDQEAISLDPITRRPGDTRLW